jgi:acyl-CoA thioester hydrolase
MLEGYRHATPITVRFGDLDAMGHLNNAKYLTYAEQARILYVREVCQLTGRWDSLGMILARIEMDFKLPVEFGDAITVYTRCSRLGGKSFDLQFVLVRGADEVVAQGLSVMVAYNYTSGQTVPIPDVWRERLRAYEPALEA